MEKNVSMLSGLGLRLCKQFHTRAYSKARLFATNTTKKQRIGVVMPPKRKNPEEQGEGEEAPKKRASPKKKAKAADEEAAAGSGGEEQAAASPAAKVGARPKVLQSDYMPKSYDANHYSHDLHSQGTAYKILSWNVNGLNACWEKGFSQYITAENADILVLQETKLQESKVPPFDAKLEALGYAHRYWNCSTAKAGYSGTAIFSKVKPVRVTYGLGPSGAHNEEGRTVNAEFDTFHLVNSYVPNSGQKLERLKWRAEVWDTAMLGHLKYLETGEDASAGAAAAENKDAEGTTVAGTKSMSSFFQPSSSSSSAAARTGAKPVIFTGDLSVAHEEIDLKNFKSNKNKTAGFCDEERAGMTNFLAAGFDDTYRRLYPEGVAYTYWGMRFNSYAGDSGWRIDYYLTSTALRDRVKGIVTRREVYGASDHCPLLLLFEK